MGAGGGLGHAYSLMFTKLGGSIIVNDVSARGAHAVVDKIKGGKVAFFSIVDGSINCMMFCQLVEKLSLLFSPLKMGSLLSKLLSCIWWCACPCCECWDPLGLVLYHYGQERVGQCHCSASEGDIQVLQGHVGYLPETKVWAYLDDCFWCWDL